MYMWVIFVYLLCHALSVSERDYVCRIIILQEQ